MDGFTETGDGLDFAIGSVTGVRWWKVSADVMRWSLEKRLPPAPVLEPPPSSLWTPVVPGGLFTHGRVIRPPASTPKKPSTKGLLVGAYGPWEAGENIAECRVSQERGHIAPAKNCRCGFWAYWDLADAPMGNWDVAGVIEGYGRATIGPRGFRVAKARIVALHLSTRIEGCNSHGEPVKDQSAAEEWRLDMEDMLREVYGVRIWSDLDAMAAYYPPNAQYATPEILDRAAMRALRLRTGLASSTEAMKHLTMTAAEVAERFDELMKQLRNADDDKEEPDPDGAG